MYLCGAVATKILQHISRRIYGLRLVCRHIPWWLSWAKGESRRRGGVTGAGDWARAKIMQYNYANRPATRRLHVCSCLYVCVLCASKRDLFLVGLRWGSPNLFAAASWCFSSFYAGPGTTKGFVLKAMDKFVDQSTQLHTGNAKFLSHSTIFKGIFVNTTFYN